jgi:hypothetical protein
MSTELPLDVQSKRDTCALFCLPIVLAAFGGDVEERMREDRIK